MVGKSRDATQRAAVISTLTAQADDPDKLKSALVDAANMAHNIWVLFLSFGTYLVVAVGSVTHRQLLLEKPIRLPLLNVELPLVAIAFPHSIKSDGTMLPPIVVGNGLSPLVSPRRASV
jgi:hypothetical protein